MAVELGLGVLADAARVEDDDVGVFQVVGAHEAVSARSAAIRSESCSFIWQPNVRTRTCGPRSRQAGDGGHVPHGVDRRAGRLGRWPSRGSGVALGADVIQIFTQSPRMWRGSSQTPKRWLSTSGVASDGTVQVHLLSRHLPHRPCTTKNEEMAERSSRCLIAPRRRLTDRVRRPRPPSRQSPRRGLPAPRRPHRRTDPEGAGRRSVDLPGTQLCPLLVQNSAGAGGTVRRSFESPLNCCPHSERFGASSHASTPTPSRIGHPLSRRPEADTVVRLSTRRWDSTDLPLHPPQRLKGRPRAKRTATKTSARGSIGKEALGLAAEPFHSSMRLRPPRGTRLRPRSTAHRPPCPAPR